MPPTSRSVQKTATGSRQMKRYTLAESISSFIFHAPTVLAWETYVQTKNLAKQSIPAQLCIIGPDLLEPAEIILHSEGNTMKFVSFVKALDVCFKMYFVFDMEFPKECINVWHFIGLYFYQMTLKDVQPAAALLVQNLEKCKFLRDMYVNKSLIVALYFQVSQLPTTFNFKFNNK